jgi:hypothetical protein
MLRRTAASSSAGAQRRGKQLSTPLRHGGSSRSKSKLNPAILIIALAATVVALSWYLFPSETYNVEQKLEREAEYVTHQMAQAEHEVEGWFHQQQQVPPAHTGDRSASDAATARMMAQSSKWVDGEKAVKRQLKKLLEQQEKGENLGVPVLTRYLGEDFPAWVTKDMDEEEWKRKVAEKYKEMGEEEEEWRKEMQKIIDQRERDIGITTA